MWLLSMKKSRKRPITNALITPTTSIGTRNLRDLTVNLRKSGGLLITTPEMNKNSGTWNVQMTLSTGSAMPACSWYMQKYIV